jgi:hypothetical protein
MRRRIIRWIIQTAALWAIQKIARKVAERFEEEDERKARTIPVDYERTNEQRLGPGVTGTVTDEATSTGGTAKPSSATGSEPPAAGA